jgi:hypothetical protein
MDANVQVASMMDVEQSAMAVTLTVTTERMEPPASGGVRDGADRGANGGGHVHDVVADVTPPMQMEVEVPMMDGSRPGVTVTSQEETARPVLSVMQATTSKAGQMEEDIAEASPKVIEAEQGSMSALLTPSATREAVSVEVSRREGSAVLEAD